MPHGSSSDKDARSVRRVSVSSRACRAWSPGSEEPEGFGAKNEDAAPG